MVVHHEFSSLFRGVHYDKKWTVPLSEWRLLAAKDIHV
jgi:hypothetical protein